MIKIRFLSWRFEIPHSPLFNDYIFISPNGDVNLFYYSILQLYTWWLISGRYNILLFYPVFRIILINILSKFFRF